MKIVALSDFPFWDARIGTAVRFETLCQSLAGVCDLTALSTAPMDTRFKHLSATLPYRLVDGHALKRIHADRGGQTIAGVPLDRQGAVTAISHFCQSGGFDAVLTPYFNRLWMIEHLPADIVRVIDTHDCQSQRSRSLAQHGMTATFVMTPETEGRELDRYDIALAMSDEDAAEFRAMSRTPIVTAPFRLPPKPIYRARPNTAELLFIAANSTVNNATLDYLMRQVLPLVGRPVTLHVVGNVDIPETVPFNVTLTHHTDVADLTWIYGAVDIALNPTFAGGGVKTKTLEAIRYAVPIVTTDEGARGLRSLLPGALIVNDKETFAHRIRTLLDDPDGRDRLSREMQDRMAGETPNAWADSFMHLLRAQRAAKLDRRVAS